MFEETGIRHPDTGPEVARRAFVFRIPSGEEVMADERFFLIRHDGSPLSRDGWTQAEVALMAEHRWWSRDDLARTTDTVYPEDLLAMLPPKG